MIFFTHKKIGIDAVSPFSFYLKIVPLTLFLISLNGCIERKIYTEIADTKMISHPPKVLKLIDPSGMLKSDFKNIPTSPISMEVHIHRAQCDNAQSKSLGADFDGYIRITLHDGNGTIARAQMDYKGEATSDDVQQVYNHLISTLKWK
jgi:hypothetical protein